MSNGGGSSDPMANVWAQTVERVKRDVIAPSLWRALERTVPVAWEEGQFVVGFAAADGTMAGQMNTGENQMAVQRALQSVAGDNELRFRVIEGTSIEDWKHAKLRDAAATAARQRTFERRTQESSSFGSWDDIYDRISRMWAVSEYRALTIGRARFVDSALDVVEQAMGELYPADGKADELTERGLSRVLDRIASYTASDPVVIACMLMDRRRKV